MDVCERGSAAGRSGLRFFLLSSRLARGLPAQGPRDGRRRT